jgi:hypothetical protein
MANLTHLDSQALKNFNDNDVTDFSSDLDKIRQTDPSGVKSLNDIVSGMTTPDALQENPVLAIGNMAGDDNLGGQSLISKVKDGAKAIDDIMIAQKTLLGDIHNNLGTTIDTLLKNQGDNLTSIDSEKMLDAFSDVDSDMGGGGTGNTGSGNTGSST